MLATFGKLDFAPATNCHPREKGRWKEGRKEAGNRVVEGWKAKVRYGRKNIKEIGCYLGQGCEDMSDTGMVNLTDRGFLRTSLIRA